MVKLTSSVVPIPTPFDEQLDLDFDSFANHLDFLYEAGVRAIIVGGTTGEGLTLSHQEKRELVKFVRNKYSDIEIYGCIVTFSLKLTDVLTAFNECNYLLVMPPFFVRPNKSDIIEFYRFLIEHCHQEIILYNNPTRTMVDISDLYEDLVRLNSRIIAVKETQFRKLPNIKWYCGEDMQILPLSGKFDGIMSVAANVAPELTSKILSSYTDQDKADWLTLLNKLHLAPNPLIVKHLLWKAGLFATPKTRFPIRIPTDLYINL